MIRAVQDVQITLHKKQDIFAVIVRKAYVLVMNILKNIDGEYVHKDCIPSVRWLLDWLQYDIKIMEDNDYE